MLAATGLSGAAPLFTQMVFAAGLETVCASGCDSTTIQGAIDAASPGDTISVEAGTYTENVNVDKAVIIEGAPGAILEVADGANSNGLSVTVNGVTIEGLDIEGPANQSYTTYPWGSNNTRGIVIDNGVTSFTITGNTIENLRNDILIDGRGDSGSSVTNNVIDNSKSGISVQYTDGSGINISGNRQGTYGNDWGINLHLNQFWDGTTLHSNPYMAVAPASAQAVISNLSTSNGGWTVQDQGYASSNRTSVVVNPSGTTTAQGDPLGPISTIQAGVDAVISGGTVNVAAGTYPEVVHITKGVTVNGANAGVNPNTGTRSAESVIDTSGGGGLGNGFYMDSDVTGVTIDGFEFDGVKGQSGAESGAVLIEGSGTTATNVTVTNNRFIGTGRGVNKDADASFHNLNVTDNYFENIGVGIGPDTYSPVKIQAEPCTASGCSDLTITGNVVDNTTYAAFLFGDVDGVNISNNTISNTATYGIGAGPNSATGGDTTIENNTISNAGTSTDGAIRIKSGTFTGSVLVQGNTITNSDIGVSVDSGTSVTGTFQVTKNAFGDTGNTGVQTGSGNALLDATDNWWGSATGPTDTISTDGSTPATNPGGSGAAAIGAVKYDPWCTAADCSTDTNAPPAAPTGLFYTYSGSTNQLACGALTNDKAGMTLHWTAPIGVLKQYAIVPTYPDGHGEYTYYPSGSATSVWIGDNFGSHGDGTYSYAIKAQNSAGVWGAVANCDLIYDSTAPTVSVTPGAGSYLHGTETFNITINDANPASSANKYTWVYLYNISTGQQYGQKVDLSSGSGTFTVNTKDLADGTYDLDVGIVYDGAGNASGTNDNYFDGYTIDNTVPSITFVKPKVDGNWYNGKLHVEVKGTDSLALKELTVHLYNSSGTYLLSGCSSINVSGTSATYSCTINTKDFSNGPYSLRAAAEDQAGNITTATRTVNFDNAKPTVTITNPVSGDYYSGTVNVQANLADSDSGLNAYRVVIQGKDSSHHWTDVYSGPWTGVSGASNSISYSWNTKNGSFPDGLYRVRVYAKDQVGNSVNTYVDVTVDNTKPTVAFTAPTPAAGSLIDNDFNVGYTASDNDVLKSVDVSLFDTDPSHSNHWVATCYDNQAETGPTDSGTCTVHLPAGLPNGTYYVQVGAQDQAGNWSVNATRTIIVDNTVLAAPTLVSPGNNSVVNGASLTNSWNPVSGATKYEYESFNSSDTSKTPRFDATYTGTSKTATNVADGTVFYWRVRAIDQYGQTGPWSDLWEVTIDNTAPDVPTNLGWTDANGNAVSNGGYTNQYSGTASWQDSSPDIDHYIYKYWNNIPGSPYDGEANAWTTTTSGTSLPGVFNQGEGTHYFCVEAVDKAGNTSACSATFTVTYDTTAPATPTASPDPTTGPFTSTQLVSLSSTDNSGNTPDIYYTTDGTTPSSTNGTLYTGAFSVSSSETVEAIAYDEAGNASPVLTAAYTITPTINSGITLTPHFTTFAAITNPQNTGTGGGGAGNGGGNGGNGNGQVLGATTTTPNTTNSDDDNQGNVKGDSTNQPNTPTNQQKSSAFLGLGWWWLLVLVILLGLLYGGRRGRSGQTE